MKPKLIYLMAAIFFALGSSQSLHSQACIAASKVTLTGNLRAANGLPAFNASLNLTPTQQGFIAGCGVNLPVGNACATSTDGSIVSLFNPTTATTLTTSGSGSLGAGTYYVVYTFYDAAAHETLASPEVVGTLSATGSLVVASPASGLPASAVGINVYISTTSGTETKQGSATGTAAYTQSSALISGSALPASNTTLCQLIANDAVWPVGTGYKVSMVDSDGNGIPGYPMVWQLMGAGNTIELSNGLPYYNGVVTYPVPLMANPFNHGTQSIAGGLSFGGYFIYNAGRVGVGTATPAWPIDVENGAINSSGGYIFNGGAGVATGNCLLADSDSFHTFRVPANCLTSIGTLFYQTVQANGTPLTQQPVLNFDATMSAANGSGKTTVGLPSVGTPGTYASPASITIDAQGRTSAVTPSSAVNRVCNSNGCYRIEADGTIEQWGTVTGCTTSGAACTVAVTFPHVFTTTTNLVVTAACSGGMDNCNVGNTSKTISGFSAVFTALVRVGGSGSELNSSESIDWHAFGN